MQPLPAKLSEAGRTERWPWEASMSEPGKNHLARPVEEHPWHRYVAMGDSFTMGYGDPDPLSPGGYRGWADCVAKELSHGQSDFSYANLAIRGAKIRQVVEKQLPQAIHLAPDLVTFQAGGNDLIRLDANPDKLAAAVDPAIEALCATGATVLIFVGPDSGPRTVLGHVRSKIALFNETLRAIATRNDAMVVDLWALRDLSDPRMWDRDRLHLSPIGHQKVAALVLDNLSVSPSSSPSSSTPCRPKPGARPGPATSSGPRNTSFHGYCAQPPSICPLRLPLPNAPPRDPSKATARHARETADPRRATLRGSRPLGPLPAWRWICAGELATTSGLLRGRYRFSSTVLSLLCFREYAKYTMNPRPAR